MQVGDLVKLSSAGEKAQQNMQCRGLIGLVIKILDDEYPYKIQWYGSERLVLNGADQTPMKRYEIKKVRKKK